MYKNVYVVGVFDLFHRGHLELLKKASILGQRVIVAVNSDVKVTQYKRRPLCSEHDRLELVRACRYVHHAFVIDSFDQKPYIEKYQVDAIVHGDEWARNTYLKQICVTEEYLQARNTHLVLLPYTYGVSTTQLIHRITDHHYATVTDKELFY